MDLVNWLMNEGSVLDGTVLANIIVLALVIELFGILSYWLPRF